MKVKTESEKVCFKNTNFVCKRVHVHLVTKVEFIKFKINSNFVCSIVIVCLGLMFRVRDHERTYTGQLNVLWFSNLKKKKKKGRLW